MSEDRAPRPAGAPSRFRLKGANAMAKETKNGKNLHAGHRARMREKVLMYGLDSMNAISYTHLSDGVVIK